MASTVLYFAYGSNLLTARLRERTPSARPIGRGLLRQYELRWHKAAADHSGKCDVIHVGEPACQVHGVVYELAVDEKPLLDAAEALGVGYGQKQVRVEVGQERLDVWLYFALQIDPAAVPYDWYKALVVGGAREHALESQYIRMLEGVHAKPDPDAVRAARHFRLSNAR